MKQLFILVLLIPCGWTIAFSQNISSKKILWNSQLDIELPAGKLDTSPSSVTTCKGDSLVWKRRNMPLEIFTITTTDGTWNNVSDPGQVIYRIENGAKKGTATFIKNASGTKVRIFIAQGDASVTHELTITTTQTIQ